MCKTNHIKELYYSELDPDRILFEKKEDVLSYMEEKNNKKNFKKCEKFFKEKFPLNSYSLSETRCPLCNKLLIRYEVDGDNFHNYKGKAEYKEKGELLKMLFGATHCNICYNKQVSLLVDIIQSDKEIIFHIISNGVEDLEHWEEKQKQKLFVKTKEYFE